MVVRVAMASTVALAALLVDRVVAATAAAAAVAEQVVLTADVWVAVHEAVAEMSAAEAGSLGTANRLS